MNKMSEFNRCSVTGVRWLKKPVEDIQIKISLKPQDSILSLPKFEDYANESNGLSFQQLENKTQEYTFKWQEKVFSLWELQRYSDVHNCISENELNYNDMIKDLDYDPSKVFTYIHEDYRSPLPVELEKIDVNDSIQNLNSCFERMALHKNVGRFVCMLGDTSSTGPLFRSTENIPTQEERWTAMHVVYDHSEYNEDSQLLLKQEATLLSLYHNRTQNYLIISPDVNDLELTPYTIETESGASLGYQYSVNVQFDQEADGEELIILLQKLYKKWERKQKQVLSFEMPPLGKRHYYITLELLTASDFDFDNLYVEFTIKVPEEIACSDALHGRTHVAKSIRKDGIEEWHFGHIIELNLEMDASSDTRPVQLFFEVISKDWWGRHRTEGYTYLSLSLIPGRYSKQLSCSRPDEMDSSAAESRRFFVGGCHLIRDLDVLAKPQLVDANFKFVSTGNLNLRWNVLSQAPLPGSLPKYEPHRVASASALLLGAEAVLQQYKKARARLAAATEGLARGEPLV